MNETMFMTPKFESDILVNEVTWPKLAHQYLVTFVEVKKSGDLTRLKPKECIRLIRCLQGDGGVMFGAVAMIVIIESDA